MIATSDTLRRALKIYRSNDDHSLFTVQYPIYRPNEVRSIRLLLAEGDLISPKQIIAEIYFQPEQGVNGA